MPPAPSRPRDRVLVVDDDPSARKALQELLRDDYDVALASGPSEALLRLQRGDFMVILTDEQMPGGSGLGLLAEIERRFPLVVGILVTGHAELPGVQAAMRNVRGATVLLKPCDGDELLQKVRGAATMARMRRATRRLGSASGKPRR